MNKPNDEWDDDESEGDSSDDDPWALDDDFEQFAKTDLIPKDVKPEDLIMCCCRKDIAHDETMKFTLKTCSHNG